MKIIFAGVRLFTTRNSECPIQAKLVLEVENKFNK
jgi:hypothetical protein